MRLYIVEIVMGILICLLVLYLIYSLYTLLSDTELLSNIRWMNHHKDEYDYESNGVYGASYDDIKYSNTCNCSKNCMCNKCQSMRAPFQHSPSLYIEELSEIEKKPESLSFSDNYVNDRYSGVVHKFTDGELMNALLNKSYLEDTGDLSEQLIADDMSAPTADNTLLAKNRHTQEMARANDAVAASINTKAIASDLAHESEEAWWGVE